MLNSQSASQSNAIIFLQQPIYDIFLSMKAKMIKHISNVTKTTVFQVDAVLKLLDEGSTVPFIARYRKEATGELDEVQILAIRDAHITFTELEKRREAILASLQERELLTPELEKAVTEADDLVQLEDIYLPYRPKRRTRAMIAREAGLEGLAVWLLAGGTGATLAAPLETLFVSAAAGASVETEALKYLNPEQKIVTAEDALAGARDIIAEVLNETKELRQDLRDFFAKRANMSSRVISIMEKDAKAAKFRDYFDWSEPAATAPSHRVLAVLRGAAEGVLITHFLPDEEEALKLLERLVLGRNKAAGNRATSQVWEAARDGYKRLTAPSLEYALEKECKERADEEAIRVFAGNMRELLLASPLGQKRILALDPGLLTGCKLVCLDGKGDLLHDDVIYPLQPKNRVAESARIVQNLCRQFSIEAIAVGNGTGGREAEAFAREAVDGLRTPAGGVIDVISVNESGASVYSASAAAREEFPQKDITVRGAVSIGRRLMDPLAELVKIDPQSIGVGQYQHDVNQRLLKRALDDVVLSCVNSVGVEINTASKQLLSYVSGISARTAEAICSYREQHGKFMSRKQLKEVAGIGAKVFEQAAGFIRIRNAANPLDASAVHPESYPVVERMAADLGCSVSDLVTRPELRRKININAYVSDSIGLPTLRDIIQELEKPGRDPRAEFEVFQFDELVHSPADLVEGMILPGIVTNVTAFGAFVDIGVHQDGLVHISQLADHFVKDPADVVKVHQKVQVKVVSVELDRKRIGLSMKGV
jgi:protein Tex